MSARATAGAALAAIGFAIGAAALVLQAALSIPLRMEAGHGLVDALTWFFTYFTILTNLMLVLIYLSELVGWRWLGWWRSPVTRGMMVGAISLVMGFYHLVLASIWEPQGLFLVADIVLHYVTPVLYVLYWLVFEPKGRLRAPDIGWMLLPPAVWLTWTMVRGALVAEYPYPVLEAHRLGYLAVGQSIGGLVAVLAVLFGAVVLLDRVLGRIGRKPDSANAQ